MAKYSINLLQADLLPAKALWTLNRVIAVWLAALVVMLALIFIAQMQLSRLNAVFQAESALNSSQTGQLQNLEATISANRKDADLLAITNLTRLS